MEGDLLGWEFLKIRQRDLGVFILPLYSFKGLLFCFVVHE